MNLNELFEAGIPAHIKPSDIPPTMRNRKLTMKDVEAERPKGAYRFRVGDKNFMDLGAAQDFAAGTGQKVERITEYKAKKKAEEPEDNFTIDDIKRLETITDLETLKAQAKQLIKGKPARRMKPEKIAYFYDSIDQLPSRLAIIKLMYDLLLAGEGHKVVGQRHSMNPNVYRQRFGEETESSQDNEKGPKHSARVKRDGADEHIIEEEKDACYNKVRSRYKVWPSAYASGALVQCRKKGAANWGNKSK